MPIREGIAEHVFTVSSADFMAVYAANNLFRGIQKYSNTGGALLGGVIANSINVAYQRELIDDFVDRTKTQVVEYIPRSITVTQSELQGKTTIEAAPNSQQAAIYRQLAERIADHQTSRVPEPLSEKELRAWAAHWATDILNMESESASLAGAGV